MYDDHDDDDDPPTNAVVSSSSDDENEENHDDEEVKEARGGDENDIFKFAENFEGIQVSTNPIANLDAMGSPVMTVTTAEQSEHELEMYHLTHEPYSYVRKAIREQVSDGLWVGKLKEIYAKIEKVSEKVDTTRYRCSVCTLPFGTCKHSEEWVRDNYNTKEFKKMLNDNPLLQTTKSKADQEIDDVMNLIKVSELKIKTVTVADDIDIMGTRWSLLEPKASDKIGDTYVSLHVPSERGWHTSVDMDASKLTIVYGGFRYKKKEIPQPFAANVRPDEVDFLNDLFVYDRYNSSWHRPKSNDDKGAVKPLGRYGHVAVALDSRRMLIFGGRGLSGRLFGDTWIYDCLLDKWTEFKSSPMFPPPPPRAFASAGAETLFANEGKVYMFGGTDGHDNYGDMWVLKYVVVENKHNPVENQMYWERIVIVGPPPAPRYGHKMVTIRPGEMAVLGGCCVSPESEIVGSGLTLNETKRLLDLSNTLQKQYKLEGESIESGGKTLASNILHSSSMKDLYKEASGIAGRVHVLENDTRLAEQELVDTYQTGLASKYIKIQKARHPDSKLDIYFLSTRDLAWRSAVYPPIKGEYPCARIYFDSFCIGNYIVVVGGAHPTSLSNKHVEVTPTNNYSKLYALDLANLRWLQPPPVETTEYFEFPMKAADMDIVRATQRVEAEKARAFSMGAKNGLTLELNEAQSVLKICKWRKAQLEKEQNSCTTPPMPRWGATFTRIGQRAFYIGGWNPSRIVDKRANYVLNMEHELERARREDDEYRSRLELDRTKDDLRNSMENIESIYELRRQLMAEKTNEAKERRLMSIEEICCTVPPLTRPKPIELIMANENTLWIEWDRVNVNADNRSIDPESVIYMVYMRNGYRKLCAEDRVLVIPPKGDTIALIGNSSASGSNSVNSKSVTTTNTLPSHRTKSSVSQSKPSSTTIAPPITGSPVMSPSALKEKVRSRNNARVDRTDDDVRSVNSELSDETTKMHGNKTDLMSSAINTYSESNIYGADELEACDVWRGRGAPGEIITVHPDGHFDVAFDDGTFEKRIPRWRIALEDPHQEFTGTDIDHNGISIKPADVFKDGMVIATKSRILRKKKYKEKVFKKLLKIQPNFRAIKDKGITFLSMPIPSLTFLFSSNREDFGVTKSTFKYLHHRRKW